MDISDDPIGYFRTREEYLAKVMVEAELLPYERPALSFASTTPSPVTSGPTEPLLTSTQYFAEALSPSLASMVADRLRAGHG